jgi:hypothetical protein
MRVPQSAQLNREDWAVPLSYLRVLRGVAESLSSQLRMQCAYTERHYE